MSLGDIKAAKYQAILKSPVKFCELFLKNRDGSPRRFWPNQVRSMECKDRLIIHQDATEVGKTIEICALILHFGCTAPKGKNRLLVIAPLTAHLLEIIDEVEHLVSDCEFLQKNLRGGRLITAIQKQPYYTMFFENGAQIDFRPAGKSGDAYKSKHVDMVIADEAAGITKKAWMQAFKRLNPGGVFRAYSYPDGRRDTEYYFRTIKTHEYVEGVEDTNCWRSGAWTVFHFPMSCRPDWTPEREQEQASELGGRDTPAYQHMVLGIHGSPAHHAFDMEAFFACFEEIPEFTCIDLTAADFKDENDFDLDPRLIDAKLRAMFPPLSKARGDGDVWIGVDTGYTTDPAELRVWRETDRNRCVLRVHMERIPYPIQAKVIAAVDRCYVARQIGIDAGGNGKGVIQDLTTRPDFADLPELTDRILSIDFGGATVIGIRDDGSEVRQSTKELMTGLLNSAMRRRSAVWPRQDTETEEQYNNHSYVKTDRHITYSKGKDHVIDADRCAFLAREWFIALRDLATGFVEEKMVSGMIVHRAL